MELASAWRTLAELDDQGLRFMQAHDLDADGTKVFLAPRDLGLMVLSDLKNRRPKFSILRLNLADLNMPSRYSI